MKKKIILGIILTITISVITFFAKSQSVPVIDTLYFNQFDLGLTGVSPSPVNTALLGESDFIQKFGNPLNTSSDYSEEQEANMTHHVYDGAEVWFLNDAVEAFSITSADYCFQLTNGTTIKVGDDINTVINLFPGSWDTKPFPDQIFVSLWHQNGPVDMTLLFQYDLNTNLITSISVQQ